jgi:spermidine/putrescine transport system ATP-binding protein
VRPERLRISRNRPDNLVSCANVYEGCVDEIIYAGFQSKYFVRVKDSILKISRQHQSHIEGEPAIAYKDSVFVWWNPSDGYVAEVGSV